MRPNSIGPGQTNSTPAGPGSLDMILRAGTVLRPAWSPGPGWVHIRSGRVEAVGSGDPPAGLPAVEFGPEAVIAPGFVDMHVHGGGGHTMTSTDPVEIGAATAYHLHHGTTSTVVSLITAPLDVLRAQLRAVAGLVGLGRRAEGHVLGSHVEGPFLSPERRGVHPVEHLRQPEPTLIETLLSSGNGTVRMLTLAPELPGSLGPRGAIRRLRDEGVTVAVGHTDADYEQCLTAFDAGASVATHLWNGMRPLGHRDPGPVAAALNHPEVTVELIADGRHVHPPAARIASRAVGGGRLALITDAVAATGAPDGEYALGPARIRRDNGRITLLDGSSLGGSDLTMAEAVRQAITVLGLPLDDAVTAATATPARALGCGAEVGTLARGREADLVVLDDDLNVTGVMSAGQWVRRPALIPAEPFRHSP